MALSQGIVDTSVFIAQERGRRFEERALPDEVMVSVITIGELIAGVVAAQDPRDRATRLATLRLAMEFDAIDIDVDVAAAWARLRVELLAVGRRLPVNDSWIAATAMALRIPVVTRDADYVTGIPGLDVIRI